MKRKIAALTTTRADYYLLRRLLKAIASDDELLLDLVVSGSHLSSKYGHTVDIVKGDGFPIKAEIDIDLSDNSLIGVCYSQGMAIQKFATYLVEHLPDVALILGDRFEVLSFAIAALHCGVPLAHIHGGEVTSGAVDDSFRHSITKMSYIHFTASNDYSRRVLQLGEDPTKVFTVGSLGVENIKKEKLLRLDELRQLIPWKDENILVTYHPETLTSCPIERQIEGLFRALERTGPCTQIIFTMPNFDAMGFFVRDQISKFIEKHSSRAIAFENMGMTLYLSAMKYVDFVIGNSSSGILEAPSLNVPTINIGARQNGRQRASSIIDCDHSEGEIAHSFEKARKLKKILAQSPTVSPFEFPDTSNQIKTILKATQVTRYPQKKFIDI